MRSDVENAIFNGRMRRAELISGGLSEQDTLEFLRGAKYLVIPSGGYYENFSLVTIEAYACGIPVIASGLGVFTETIEPNKTGLLFEPGNAEDLAKKVSWAEAHPQDMAEMGLNGRRVYESKYTPEVNYEILMSIYHKAIEHHKNLKPFCPNWLRYSPKALKHTVEKGPNDNGHGYGPIQIGPVAARCRDAPPRVLRAPHSAISPPATRIIRPDIAPGGP